MVPELGILGILKFQNFPGMCLGSPLGAYSTSTNSRDCNQSHIRWCNPQPTTEYRYPRGPYGEESPNKFLTPKLFWPQKCFWNVFDQIIFWPPNFGIKEFHRWISGEFRPQYFTDRPVNYGLRSIFYWPENIRWSPFFGFTGKLRQHEFDINSPYK